MQTIRCGLRVLVLFAVAPAAPVMAEPPQSAQPNSTAAWNPQLAAKYLDDRAAAWLAWPKSQQADGTTCVSCHTVFPYLSARAALRRKISGDAPSLDAQLAHVSKRVEHWHDGQPWYGFSEEKTAESRATESVLSALALAIRDAESVEPRLRDDTKAALDAMWSTQHKDGPAAGSWPWLAFKLDPWESDGAEFWGATLAALAVGFAPQNYADQPEIAPQLAMLREYLNGHAQSDKPNLHHRAMLLLASRRGKGLLDGPSQEVVVRDLLAAQLSDGSWSMDALGNWKLKQPAGDAYATGLCAFVLWHVDNPPCRAAAKRGCQWLVAHQDPSSGAWPSKSVNKTRDPNSFVGQFMQDAATGFATLALLVNEQ